MSSGNGRGFYHGRRADVGPVVGLCEGDAHVWASQSRTSLEQWPSVSGPCRPCREASAPPAPRGAELGRSGVGRERPVPRGSQAVPALSLQLRGCAVGSAAVPTPHFSVALSPSKSPAGPAACRLLPQRRQPWRPRGHVGVPRVTLPRGVQQSEGPGLREKGHSPRERKPGPGCGAAESSGGRDSNGEFRERRGRRTGS